MRLSREELITKLRPIQLIGNEFHITDVDLVTSDTRELSGRSLFVAVKGEVVDGHDFIGEAYDRGAVIVVGEREFIPPQGKVYIRVPSSREAERILLREFYGFPEQEMILVGVTGTNGKTTVTYLLESILRRAGMEPGVMGTINRRFCHRSYESPNTTPSFREILKVLTEMKECGVKAVAMEVSSHAIVQERIRGLLFDAGIFTNLSRDHLDYHGSMEEYYQAKARFFKEVLPEGKEGSFAVIGIDNDWGRRLAEEIEGYPVYTYGKDRGDLRLSSLEINNFRMKLRIEMESESFEIETELFGDYNAENIMAAFLTAYKLGIRADLIVAGIEDLKAVPGRLEKIPLPSGAVVFIDYAHTPDAMENVLRAVRKYAEGRIITVFGAGGDRDRGKRAPMGEVAARYSDLVIVTSDNPRSEDPESIIDMIVEGIERVTENFRRIPDRREAIFSALRQAGENDIVMILGKGHEDYQIIGNRKLHFSDREVVNEFLGGVR